MNPNNRTVILQGWLHNPYGGKHIKLTQGPRYRCKSVQLSQKFYRLLGSKVRITIEPKR
jgi:hypothetical protein